MSSTRRPKQTRTVTLDDLGNNSALVTRLALRNGGVAVVDQDGKKVCQLVIPNKPLTD